MPESTYADPTEARRLAELAACEIVGTPAEPEYDFLARLAADLCATPMAAITFIDADHQHGKAGVGVDSLDIEREHSFCAHTISSRAPLVVNDALRDARFQENPLVLDDPCIRFYAGVPLITESGAVLGAISVMDRVPRQLSGDQIEQLRGLAGQVAALVASRRDRGELDRARAATRAFEDGPAVTAAAFVTAFDPMLLVSRDRRLVDANDAATELFGREVGDLRRLRVEDIVDGFEAADVRALWESFLEHGRSRGELVIRRPDGATVLAEFGANANPQTGLQLVVLRDITERRRIEREALDVRARLEETQAVARIVSWELGVPPSGEEQDETVQMLVWPDAATSMTHEEFVEYVHPDDRESYLAVIGEALATGEPYRNRFRLVTAEGEVRTVDTRGQAERDAEGNIVRLFGSSQDVTDEEQAAQALRVQAQVLDQLPVAVIASDADRNITLFNGGAISMFAVEREEALGRRFDDLGLTPPQSMATRAEMHSRLGAGLSWEGEIELRSRTGRTFPSLVTNSPIRNERGEIVSYVGVIVDVDDQRRMEEEARAAKLETIKRLARAVEKRDPETGGHSERIGEFAAMLAERLGLPSEQVELIRVSSPMHDVGKIGIPDAILLKPGALTDAERREMERHTQIGYDILGGSQSELLDMAARIALTHHERMDGAGYPSGLAGKAIPVEGRIVAVADVFDALTSDRVYRAAFSTEEALAIMSEERGKHFDPEILDLLLADVAAFEAVLGIRS